MTTDHHYLTIEALSVIHIFYMEHNIRSTTDVRLMFLAKVAVVYKFITRSPAVAKTADRTGCQ